MLTMSGTCGSGAEACGAGAGQWEQQGEEMLLRCCGRPSLLDHHLAALRAWGWAALLPGHRAMGGMAVGISPRQSCTLGVMAVAAAWSAQPWKGDCGLTACLHPTLQCSKLCLGYQLEAPGPGCTQGPSRQRGSELL